MKKFLALAAVVALVGCEKKADTIPAADSGAMMIPADTSSMLAHDSAMMNDSMMRADSPMRADSLMPRDTMRQM